MINIDNLMDKKKDNDMEAVVIFGVGGKLACKQSMAFA